MGPARFVALFLALLWAYSHTGASSAWSAPQEECTGCWAFSTGLDEASCEDENENERYVFIDLVLEDGKCLTPHGGPPANCGVEKPCTAYILLGWKLPSGIQVLQCITRPNTITVCVYPPPEADGTDESTFREQPQNCSGQEVRYSIRGPSPCGLLEAQASGWCHECGWS